MHTAIERLAVWRDAKGLFEVGHERGQDVHVLVAGEPCPLAVLQQPNARLVCVWRSAVGRIQGFFCSHLKALDAKLAVMRRVAVADERCVHAPARHDSAMQHRVAVLVARQSFFGAGFVDEQARAWRKCGCEEGERLGRGAREAIDAPRGRLAGVDGVVQGICGSEGHQHDLRGNVCVALGVRHEPIDEIDDAAVAREQDDAQGCTVVCGGEEDGAGVFGDAGCRGGGVDCQAFGFAMEGNEDGFDDVLKEGVCLAGA